jgi:hypothetical protein
LKFQGWVAVAQGTAATLDYHFDKILLTAQTTNVLDDELQFPKSIAVTCPN